MLIVLYVFASVALAQNQKAGASSIQRIVDGCAILKTGQTHRAAARVLIFTTGAKRSGDRAWVGSNGGVIDFEGEYKNCAMRYASADTSANGQKTSRRMTFFNLGDKVRQLLETSTDDGKTWTVAFDETYIRKKQ